MAVPCRSPIVCRYRLVVGGRSCFVTRALLLLLLLLLLPRRHSRWFAAELRRGAPYSLSSVG